MEQVPIEIQIAATKFIQSPTRKHWKWLVHLFRVERRKEQRQQQRLEEEEGAPCDEDVMGEVVVMPDEVESDLVHIVTEESCVGCEDEHIDFGMVVVYENEEESIDDNNDKHEDDDDGIEQAVDNDEHVEEESVSNKEDEEETTIVEQPVEKNEEEEEEEEEHALLIQERRPINVLETTISLISHPTSDISSSSLHTSSVSRSKCDHRDWMAAFRLIYQLLWLSKAWVELTAFVNRFCTRKR